LFFFLGVAETVFKAGCLLLFCYGAYFIFDTVAKRARSPHSTVVNTVDSAANNTVESAVADNSVENSTINTDKNAATNLLEFSAHASDEVSGGETIIASAVEDLTPTEAVPQSSVATKSTNSRNLAASTSDSEQSPAPVETPAILQGDAAVDWLKSLNSSEFVVQFASTPDWNAISQFAGQHLPDDAVIYAYKRTPSGRPIYGVASKKVFDSLDSAKTALETLASPTLKEDPWIRPVTQLLEAVSAAENPGQ
jgi:septal ring-binding cell division protein DamX